MKSTLLLGSALLAAGFARLLAADATPINRVIASLEIETDDPTGYAHWIAEGNKIAKEKIGVDKYQQVLQAVYEGDKGNKRLWVVRSAESVAQLTKQSAALANDPARLKLYDHFNLIRKSHGMVLYQGLRYERTTPNGHSLVTRMNVSDEAAYVAAAEELRALYDKAGFKDVTLSIYRVIAGRTGFSHVAVLTASSAERLAEFMDAAQRDTAVREWLAKSGKFRTVVSNLTHKNITP
jgi:hypothetical protein